MQKQQILDSFAINLERERIKLGLSQRQMAEKLGLHQTTYRNLIDGNMQKIDVLTFVKLYEITGKLAFEFIDFGKEDRRLQIISKIKHLSEHQLLYINAIVEFENAFYKEHENNIEDYISVFIPTGDCQDGMIYDSSSVEKINIARYRKIFGDKIHYGLKITSNHLHPAYNRDDILLITREPIRDGDIGIFLKKETQRVYLRKFRQTVPCRLEPINDYGVTFEVDPNDFDDMNKWVKFGKVLTKIR